MNVEYRFQPKCAGVQEPQYQSDGASGFDLHADATMVIQPGERALVPTGFYVSIPDGFELQVRPRSGLAAKKGITVLNAPGTVDADYRGEVQVILANLGPDPFPIVANDRIAQAVIAPVIRATLVKVDTLSETVRGAGGFGSTGVRT